MLHAKQPKASFRPIKSRSRPGEIMNINVWLRLDVGEALDADAEARGITRRAMLEMILGERYARGKR